MASYQSAALRQAPGYAPRASSTAAFTPNVPTMGGLPTVTPLANDANTPGYLQRQMLSQQLGQLPAQQNAALTGLQAQAKQALAGYGGYQFQSDDPNTPQREDLLLNYNAAKGMGEREKVAYRQQRDMANAQGVGESGIANQNIASAIQRVSLEAQQIVNQYATAINQTATQYANQAAGIASEWAGLYGSDSAWLVQNAPPAPPLPPNDYNGSSYSNATIEQAAAPYLDWQKAQGVSTLPTVPAGFRGFATNVPPRARR